MSFLQLRSGKYNPLAGKTTPPVPPDTQVDVWYSSYPDRLNPLPSLSPALQAGSFFGPPPSVRDLGHIGWDPKYPNQIDRWTLATANQIAFTTGSTASSIPPPNLSWRSGTGYPDRIPTIRPPTEAYPFTSAFAPFPEAPIALAARAFYPDRIHRVTLPVAQQQAWTSHLKPEQTISLGRAIFPDRIDRVTVAAANQRATFTPDFLPLADLRWRNTYPDHIDRRVVRTADQRASFTPDFLPLADLRWLSTYPDRIDRGVMPSSLQWTLSLDPFPRPQAEIQYWTPVYPDWLPLSRPINTIAVGVQNLEPLPNVVTYVTSVYPDRFSSPVLTLVPSTTSPVQPEAPIALAARAFYPDRLDRSSLYLPPTFTISLAPEAPIALAARAIYPDRLDRLVLSTAAHLAFTANLAPEQRLPSPWISSFPSQIARTVLPVALHPTLTLDAFPRPAAPRLFAWALFPDRIDRFVVDPARIPSFSYGTLEPIPNAPVIGGGDEKIHLGTKESIGVTSQPTLGGWQAW